MIGRTMLSLVSLVLLGLAPGFASPPASVAGTPCTPVTIGLDPAIRTMVRGTFLGGALGQTFYAPETSISRVTVWRPPNDIDAVGTHLWITGVDTAVFVGQPITSDLLLDGPTVFIRDSDPPGQLIEMSFVIDPPLALPGPGTYAFFLQREHCDGGETFIIGSDVDPYPQGIYWITPRISMAECHLRPVTGGGNNDDLLFRIEFCGGLPTPARSKTWGELKAIYR